MVVPTKISRVGFAVIKLRLRGENVFLMRRSRKWDDVSFIGGHENQRDSGRLSRAAYRELLEEVPTLRASTNLELSELTNEFCYGPVYSPSATSTVGYEIQFFHVEFLSSPVAAIAALTPKSLNILLSERELLGAQKYKIAALVDLLNEVLHGGLMAVPLSWPGDLASPLNEAVYAGEQLHLRLARQ